MAEYGLLTEVVVVPRTTALAVDAAVSDIELEVVNAGDYDSDGGTLELNGDQLDYTGIVWGVTEDDTDLIELSAPLAVAGSAGDPVAPVIGGVAAEDWYAVIDMGGGGDVVHVPIRFNQRASIAPGIYNDPWRVTVAEDLSAIEDLPGVTPGGRVVAWNADAATATADDTAVPIQLTYLPQPKSVQVKQNGTDLLPSEWDLEDQVITVSPSTEVVIRAGDHFAAYYDYDGGRLVTASAPATPITYRDASPGTTDAWTIPALAEEGDLLVAVGMCNSSKVISENGWTLVGESSSVTHLASSGATYTYRLVVLSKVYDGTSTVPTVSAGVPQSVCLMVAFEGGTEVDAIFSTLTDGAAADTPAFNPSSLRVWGTVANLQTITPADGTQVGYSGGNDIDIVMTQDSATGARTASVASTAGWCLGSLVVR